MSNIETVEDLFKNTKHNPSYSQLHKSLKANHAITDYCIPVNSYFPTPMMMEKLMNKIPEALKYYPDSGENMAKELSPFVGVPAENLVLSNGSTELITWIDHLLIKENIAVTVPTFGRWTDQPFETGKKLNLYHHQERNLFHLDLDDYANFILKTKSRVAVICNPNNPTGNINSREEIIQFIEKLPQLDLIVIDESFLTDVTKSWKFENAGTFALKETNESTRFYALKLN